MAGSLRPVPDAPALLLEPDRGRRRWLIVSDLHLGLESRPERPSGPPEGSAERMAEEILALARHQSAAGILVAGDVKHPIVGTPTHLRRIVFGFFAEILGAGLDAEVVLGNHDVGLVPHLPREVTVHPADGRVLDGIGIFHGHRWPSERVLGCSRLVAGHLHPGYRFAPTTEFPDGKRRCWVRVERTPPAPVPGKKRPVPRVRAREIVILPAFNPLAGVESLNRDRPARGRSFLFRRFLADGIARAYLLDGTDLGVVPTVLRGSRATRPAPAARPGR